jgi:uncharacterized protein YbjT (DUF2867 family)
MAVVAVVGGTGNVGKTLVNTLKKSKKHEVIIFARKVNGCIKLNRVYHLFADNQEQVPEGESAAPVFSIDYNNVEQLVKTLEKNNVHTVISTIIMMDPAATKAEVNVVAAAAKSSPTKRFVASNWGAASPGEE